MEKRGQITIFIIIGITVLILTLFIFSRKMDSDREILQRPLDKASEEKYLNIFIGDCMKSVLARAVDRYGLDESDAPYNINGFMLSNLSSCFNDFSIFRDKGYDIQIGDLDLDTKITDEKVTSVITYPLVFKRLDVVFTFDQAQFSLQRQVFGQKNRAVSSDNTLILEYGSGMEAGIRLEDNYFMGRDDRIASSLVYDIISSEDIDSDISIYYGQILFPENLTGWSIGYFDGTNWKILDTKIDIEKKRAAAKLKGAYPVALISPAAISGDCTYCNSGGWEKVWKEKLTVWDPEGMAKCTGEKCCKAHCPPNTKALPVPYYNQCQPDMRVNMCSGDAYRYCDTFCGPASVKMVSDYFGKTARVQDFWQDIKGPISEGGCGGDSNWERMAPYMSNSIGEQFSFVQDSNRDFSAITTEIDKGYPVIAGVVIKCPQDTCYCNDNIGHVLVVIGYSTTDNGYYIINDPFTATGGSKTECSDWALGSHVVISKENFGKIQRTDARRIIKA